MCWMWWSGIGCWRGGMTRRWSWRGRRRRGCLRGRWRGLRMRWRWRAGGRGCRMPSWGLGRVGGRGICGGGGGGGAGGGAGGGRGGGYRGGVGGGPESVVGVCLERGVGLMVALLGVLGAGGVYLPVDPEYPAERIAFMLADAAPAAVLASSGTAGVLAGARSGG